MKDWQKEDYSGDFEFDVGELDKKLGEEKSEKPAEKRKKEQAEEKIVDAAEEIGEKPAGAKKRRTGGWKDKKAKSDEEKKQQKLRRAKERKIGGKIDRQKMREKKADLKFDPASVRQGIIMKEILSPPRAKSPHPVFKRKGGLS
ncbi:hypothetical protein [Halarsenatibacter silvermanii]|uniref:Uncharacterized protein n=1 Tax=Halarsenatibacter silvermanii TaxID=321763 RepID=A0A1G9GWJ7_9FIRM|nr:hypothetical protein [Halarsenatibacter silvermanii]SDL05059.1 hypothetical protein SAMN04488692_10128 [Halarsenatibacter silvermanii]